MRPRPSRPGRTNARGVLMNILLFSMPNSFEHTPTIAVRMPNGALTSLAGNVDPHHRVAAADFSFKSTGIWSPSSGSWPSTSPTSSGSR